ncbi:MAG: Na+/glucose cotransporter [Sorangiineae bacterium NIC37A_2]|nr:MAG: Na+/glucose cotransporter [Sorangiineae bacterium NIC37A_2]
MQPIDWLVVALYFSVLVFIVWKSSQKQQTSTDYFLAGRDIGWFAVGCSLLASNVGSEHIVGLAGNGATSGMAMAHWELQAWVMLLLGWVFVPFYYRSGVFTMPEFLERRFDASTRLVLSCVSLVAYVFTKVSVTVFAGALVFQTLLPDTFGNPDNAFMVGAVTTVVLTGIYTVFGGFRAVVYTEVAQTGLLILGSAFITIFGLAQLGGWGELRQIVSEKSSTFALWRPLEDPDFPWLGVMIASVIIGVWYWCTDQYIVQRTLAAKSLKDARRGAIFGGYLKVLPVFIFLIPGMIGYALHQKGIISIPSDSDGNVSGDMVFPTMVASLLPAGLRGVVIAGVLSALMSSLASLFNSAATLFTVDIYEKIRPGRPEKHLVMVGRMATGIVVVLGLLWIPVMKFISGGGLYQYLQSVQGYLAPPITAVFLLGLFVKRVNARGALYGLSIGFILGMTKLTLQALAGAGVMSSEGLLGSIAQLNFLYASGWLFLISVLVVVFASLSAPAQPATQIAGLTYSGLSPAEQAENRESWGASDVIASVLLVALVLVVYVYFSFWI